MGPDWAGEVTCARIDSVFSVGALIGQPPFGIGHDRQGDVNIVTSLFQINICPLGLKAQVEKCTGIT